MAFNDDDVTVRIGADNRKFGAGMRGAHKDLAGFESRAVKMGKNIAKIGAVAAAALVGVGVAMVRSAGTAATEIRNLSQLAGVGVEEFQKYTAASDTLGISQEKLADILKDVNDKFGDFAATGQGPLKDFFDYIAPAVGVTADEFARLSGPEALQLYVSSLEKAGVSQQQMTFYMEALASDATGLLPLLRDNGKELARLGDEADRAGRIMSAAAVNDAAALDREMKEMGATIRDNLNRAIADNSDEILELAEMITDTWVPALIGVAGFIGDVIGAIAQMVTAIGNSLSKIKQFGITVAEALGWDGETTGSVGRLNNRTRNNKGQLPPPGNTTGTPLTEAIYPPLPGTTGTGLTLADVSLPPPPNISIKPDNNGNGGGGGGVNRGPTREDLERLQEGFASQREIVEAEYAEQLEQLRAFRENKLGTEEEFDALESDIRKKHQEDMARLEQQERAARLQAAQSMLGDMANLMASENKKLFKVGQAAALAKAVVNGYEAASSAWAKGMAAGGPPLAAAFTAASLARTGALVSSIATASPSGGGGGGGGGRGGVVTTGAAAAQTSREATIQLVGGDVFGGSQIRDLINAINREQEDGSVILRVT